MRSGVLAFLVLALGAQAVPPQPPPGSGQQPAPAPTGVISGVVVDVATGAPIADAVVFLAAGRIASGVQPRQFSDSRGRFVFTGLPPAPNYALSASKPGYLTGGYADESTPGARNGLIALEDGEFVSSARLALTPTGAISGTITDEAGEPVVGVTVRLLVRIAIQGRPHLASGPTTTTDDRGEYRFASVAPGRYLVAVPSTHATVPAGTSLGTRESPGAAIDVTPSTRLVIGRTPLPPPPRDGVAMAYPYAFAQATSIVAQATVIDLKPGEDRTNIGVRLEPVPTGTLSGVVEGPAAALERLTLRLVAEGLEGLGHGAETATALVGADGRFEFANVPAGIYTLDAPLSLSELALIDSTRNQLPGRPTAPPGIGGWSMNSSDASGVPAGIRTVRVNFRGDAANHFAQTPVTIRGGESGNIVLQLRPLGRMSGRVVIDPDSVKAADGSLAVAPGVRLEPATGDPAIGFPNQRFDPKAPRDQFVIEGLRAAPYVLRIAGVGSWMIKSVIWRGRDYLDEPFDVAATPDFDDVVVTVTRSVPVVSGLVRDDRGRVADAAAVIIFPLLPAQWTGYGLSPSRIRMTRTSSAGAYKLSAPPGDYYLIVVPATQAMAWQDPAFLEKAAAGAARVSLDWGGTASRDLVLR